MHRDNPPRATSIDRGVKPSAGWSATFPTRVEVSVRAKPESSAPAIDLAVRVRDAEYRPLDNAKVVLAGHVAGRRQRLDRRRARRPRSRHVLGDLCHQAAGADRVLATATAPDGSAVGAREAGWAAQPAADEFARLRAGPRVLEIDRDTNRTAKSSTASSSTRSSPASPSRSAPITETWTSPLWHQPLYFLIAITCLAAEWGLRRINGLA